MRLYSVHVHAGDESVPDISTWTAHLQHSSNRTQNGHPEPDIDTRTAATESESLSLEPKFQDLHCKVAALDCIVVTVVYTQCQ